MVGSPAGIWIFGRGGMAGSASEVIALMLGVSRSADNEELCLETETIQK